MKTITRKGVLSGLISVLISLPAVSQQQAPQAPEAQPLNSIEVLVNDEPISSFDINQRLRLVIAISGGVTTQQEFLQVREQVIRSMVDERLQMQEAAEVELTIEKAQLDQFFDRRAESVGQESAQFAEALQAIGSSKQSMQSQMEAEISWSQLVQGRLGAFVSVSDEEVEASIQRIYANRGKFEYRLGEVVLLADSPEQAAAVEANAVQLVEQIRSGATFGDIAQQLSASSTAAVGGDLGWATTDELDPTYRAQVEAGDVGSVLDPIRTPGGYVILAVRDRRRVLTVDPLDAQVSLRQLHIGTDEVAEKRAQFESVVSDLKDRTITCGEIPGLASEAGVTTQTEIAPLRLRDLQGEIRARVETLEIGEATDIVELEDGIRVLVLCDKVEPTVQEPDFDAIYDQIEQQRLSMMARRYLRDIRRDAIVDYR